MGPTSGDCAAARLVVRASWAVLLVEAALFAAYAALEASPWRYRSFAALTFITALVISYAAVACGMAGMIAGGLYRSTRAVAVSAALTLAGVAGFVLAQVHPPRWLDV